MVQQQFNRSFSRMSMRAFCNDGKLRQSLPLFTNLLPMGFSSRMPVCVTVRTYRSFIALMKYYHAQTGTPEVVTRVEREEQWDFLQIMC